MPGEHDSSPANAPASTNVSQYWDANNALDPAENQHGPTGWVTIPTCTPAASQNFAGVRQWGLDASLVKNIPFGERFNVRFNADFFNVLNPPGNPNSIGGDGMLSTQQFRARGRARCN